MNAGFGTDKLVTAGTGAAEGAAAGGGGAGDQVHWIFKNKDHGKISATASLGMVTQWDVEGGLPMVG